MKKAYEIKGISNINGTIKVQGSKNSALAIIVASLLCKDKVTLYNVPNIKDVIELLEILKKINVDVSFIDNTLNIDSTNIEYKSLLLDEVNKFRASYYFIGAFLSLFNKVEIYLPGGCNIGKRPIDQHIKALNALNVNICLSSSIIKASSSEIKGEEITLDIPSVGATINTILTCILKGGTTIIKNAAKEVEIVDFVNFLNAMGANIIGAGSSVICINSVSKLHGVKYTIMPDRIVTGTYLIYGALLANKLTLTNINSKDNQALINVLVNLGAQMDIRKNSISIFKLDEFDKINIKTGIHPSFPSDLMQIIATLLFFGNGISLVEETLFENRFNFLKQIEKMNGKYFIYDNKALIIPSLLKSSVVECEDLRGGAALLLAAMASEGVSIIKDVEYIERGYEDIVSVLSSVGVDIKEIELYEA